MEVIVAIDPVNDAPRRQHYYFAHQYLRERAQQHPALLIRELRKESATKYLGFLWITRGSAVVDNEGDFIPATGLRCFPIDIADSYYGALVQFPTPEKMTEAYFVAILMPTGKEDPAFCEFYTLEFTMNEDRRNGTILGKWQGGSHFNFGAGPPPDKQAFLEALEKHLTA
jgi:hypothetical protein